MTGPELVEAARLDGDLPEEVKVGDVFKRVAMRVRDGGRFQVTARDHTLIRITAVPGGRRSKYSYVKVDPKGMGNGRPDRGEHRCDLLALAHHYSIEGSADA